MMDIFDLEIPDNMQTNSYISELVVYADCCMYKEADACLDEAMRYDPEEHLFKRLSARLQGVMHQQADLFSSETAGSHSPASDVS